MGFVMSLKKRVPWSLVPSGLASGVSLDTLSALMLIPAPEPVPDWLSGWTPTHDNEHQVVLGPAAMTAYLGDPWTRHQETFRRARRPRPAPNQPPPGR